VRDLDLQRAARLEGEVPEIDEARLGGADPDRDRRPPERSQLQRRPRGPAAGELAAPILFAVIDVS